MREVTVSFVLTDRELGSWRYEDLERLSRLKMAACGMAKITGKHQCPDRMETTYYGPPTPQKLAEIMAMEAVTALDNSSPSLRQTESLGSVRPGDRYLDLKRKRNRG